MLCVSVCPSVAEPPGPGAEQRFSSSSCAITDIVIKFSFSKETWCVYFKSKLFDKNPKPQPKTVSPWRFQESGKNAKWKQM